MWSHRALVKMWAHRALVKMWSHVALVKCGPIELWSTVVHYLEKRVPFGTQTFHPVSLQMLFFPSLFLC
jgi:ureidoglycolate hydrolase